MKKYILTLILGLLTFVGFGQYLVDFESSSKPAYSNNPLPDTVTLSGIRWEMKESLIGGLVADYLVGSKSARFRGKPGSSMTMLQNKTNGIGNISFTYRKYISDSTDSHKPYSIQYSIDNGFNWIPISTITASMVTQTFSQTINISGSVRIRIILIGPGTSGSATSRRFNIDNILLTNYNTSLPIELISFDGTKKQNYNLLEWTTASESNNDYFILERSEDGIIWTNIGNIDGSGNSNTKMNYSFTDVTFSRKINYYRLSQVDYNGVSETFDLISINNSISRKTISKYYNLLGQEVDEYQTGIIILQYEDGTIEKVIR